jgi:hypothetical protein
MRQAEITTQNVEAPIHLLSVEELQFDAHDDAITGITKPEGLTPDLDLSQHVEKSWPSSKNVSQ